MEEFHAKDAGGWGGVRRRWLSKLCSWQSLPITKARSIPFRPGAKHPVTRQANSAATHAAKCKGATTRPSKLEWTDEQRVVLINPSTASAVPNSPLSGLPLHIMSIVTANWKRPFICTSMFISFLWRKYSYLFIPATTCDELVLVQPNI